MTLSARPSRTSELLHAISIDESQTEFTMDDLLKRFHHRAFGMLLLIFTLPNFIPSPVGVAGIMGPIVSLLGLQLLLGFDHPWLPKWFRRRSVSRVFIGKIYQRLGGALRFVETMSKPRMMSVATGPGLRMTGFLLVGLGIALALPIPFTNYPFGFLLLGYAIGLIERDGALLLISWLVGVVTLIAFYFLGQKMVLIAIEYLRSWFAG